MRPLPTIVILLISCAVAIAASHDDHEASVPPAATCGSDVSTAPSTAQTRKTGAHIVVTAPRPRTLEDEQKASEIVRALQRNLRPYRDHRNAIADGYQPFLPNLPQHEYHFTNYRVAIGAAFRFDPEKPTSLLYEKNGGSYRLRGAMYTAPRHASMEDLDERVPLSVAGWHAHVNICLPQRGEAANVSWKEFGPGGSIDTREECNRAGGRFHPQLFGWMVHVYPWDPDPFAHHM